MKVILMIKQIVYKIIKVAKKQKKELIIINIMIRLVITFILASLIISGLLKVVGFNLVYIVLLILFVATGIFFVVKFVLRNMEKAISYEITIGNKNSKHKLHACLINQETKEVIQITKTEFVLGRMKGSVDHVIKVASVGKIHAKILIEDGQFYLVDLGSKNGTYVNGKRIKRDVKYNIGTKSEIIFAKTEFELKIYIKNKV